MRKWSRRYDGEKSGRVGAGRFSPRAGSDDNRGWLQRGRGERVVRGTPIEVSHHHRVVVVGSGGRKGSVEEAHIRPLSGPVGGGDAERGKFYRNVAVGVRADDVGLAKCGSPKDSCASVGVGWSGEGYIIAVSFGEAVSPTWVNLRVFCFLECDDLRFMVGCVGEDFLEAGPACDFKSGHVDGKNA